MEIQILESVCLILTLHLKNLVFILSFIALTTIKFKLFICINLVLKILLYKSTLRYPFSMKESRFLLQANLFLLRLQKLSFIFLDYYMMTLSTK